MLPPSRYKPLLVFYTDTTFPQDFSSNRYYFVAVLASFIPLSFYPSYSPLFLLPRRNIFHATLALSPPPVTFISLYTCHALWINHQEWFYGRSFYRSSPLFSCFVETFFLCLSPLSFFVSTSHFLRPNHQRHNTLSNATSFSNTIYRRGTVVFASS